MKLNTEIIFVTGFSQMSMNFYIPFFAIWAVTLSKSLVTEKGEQGAKNHLCH